MIKISVLIVVLVSTVSIAAMNSHPSIMSSADLASFPNPPADARIHYGDKPLQFGDLRVPRGEGPHPVAVFVHGGCWLSEYDVAHSSKLTDALAMNGIATWSLEYRRVGDAGGGWPGTFEDVARGADHLRTIAEVHNLDLERVIAMGHSAGGQLALWLGARPRLPDEAPGVTKEPLVLQGILGLAAAADLGFLHEQAFCGQVVDKLMGGSPDEVPEHYLWGNPAQIAPVDIPQILVIGAFDDTWGPVSRRYAGIAEKRGDDVRVLDAAASGHFEMIDPDSSTWPIVLDAARELLGLGD